MDRASKMLAPPLGLGLVEGGLCRMVVATAVACSFQTGCGRNLWGMQGEGCGGGGIDLEPRVRECFIPVFSYPNGFYFNPSIDQAFWAQHGSSWGECGH